MYLTLAEFLAEIGMAERIVSAEHVVSALRERKSAFEIASMREAIRHTEEIFGKVSRFIKPDKTERDIAAFMTAELARAELQPAWAASTCPAVFSGPDTAEAHYGPTGRVVERGHVLNMDFGVKVNGYCSDMQRSFYILREKETIAPEQVCRGFATIINALESARKSMKPGVHGIEIDAIARKVVTAAGYEEFPHALGHQVGRFAHDGTALLGPAWEKYGKKPYKPLEENMIFAIEPRLTVQGHGIVTVEDMAIVTAKGAEWLSNVQKELIIIK
jgi:Xaa-Pro aminopeptidase